MKFKSINYLIKPWQAILLAVVISSALLSDVENIALEAGAVVRLVYEMDFSVQTKADESPVTIADQQAEAVILAGLANLDPGIPVVAEESVAAGRIPTVDTRTPRFWLVDPLDGTKEFIHRNGEFTVNIALIEAGEPVLGVVLAPALGSGNGTLYSGARGLGAFRRDAAGRRAILCRRVPQSGLRYAPTKNCPAPRRIAAKGAESASAAVKRAVPAAKCGRQHHTEHWFSSLDQSDVDGELAIAVDEFFGAIEWIDQPKAWRAGIDGRDTTGRIPTVDTRTPRFWLVDPLDGTKEFIHRNGEFTVNIALIEAGEPVLGVVLAPALGSGNGTLYSGARGLGAFRRDAAGRRAILCRRVPQSGLRYAPTKNCPAPRRIAAKGAESASAAVKRAVPAAKCGRQHHTEHWFSSLDQSDVDGELAIAVDEFFGAIEWIDQPKAWRAGIDGRDTTGGDRLFGNDGYPGIEVREPRQNDGLGLLIGNGDGGLIGLGLHRKIHLVDETNHRACLEGDVFDVAEQGAGDDHGQEYSLPRLD